MDNKISAALILSLGLVISATIISRNGGIRFVVEMPTSDIGRYQRFSRSDEVSLESGCFDTVTGVEFRHTVVPGAKINKFIQSDYKSGQNILLSDDWE